jgi:hypothetical protein
MDNTNEKLIILRIVRPALIHLLRLMWHKLKILWQMNNARKHPPI